jgi:FtsP/CotA-like multicopper oxidase with cupredoxin domain
MQDGFPWPQMPAVPAGTTRSYDYQPISGTYWMHSHHGLQEQSLMTAPLIVQSAAEAREDRQDIVMMLHDFSFRAPLELLAGLTGTTVAAAERMATQMENVPSPRAGRPRMAPALPAGTSSTPPMGMPGGW